MKDSDAVKPLTKREIFISTLLVVVVIGGALFHTGFQHAMAEQLVAQAAAASKLPPSRIRLMQDLNQARAQNGLPPLIEDARLDNSAQTKADDMVARNYYDHPDPDGKQGYTYAEAAVPSCIYVEENLVEATSASNAFTQWMGSAPHKADILNSQVSITGFGIAAHGAYFYIVEHFCQLSSGAPVQAVTTTQSTPIAPITYTPSTYTPQNYFSAPATTTPTTSTPSTSPTAAQIRQQEIQACLSKVNALGAGDSSATEACYAIQ